LLVKPPTHLLVVVDPDPPFETPGRVEMQRQRIVDEMVAVVRAQGVDPDRAELESLVEVTTWSERCFEFAHFTDSELAGAIVAIHPDCNGLDRGALEGALAMQRQHHNEIKNVWSKWRRAPSKTALAEALWPVLRTKLDAAAADSSIAPPPIALRLIDAFRKAVQRPHGRFRLHGVALPGSSRLAVPPPRHERGTRTSTRVPGRGQGRVGPRNPG
jgi:hypothetical protein